MHIANHQPLYHFRAQAFAGRAGFPLAAWLPTSEGEMRAGQPDRQTGAAGMERGLQGQRVGEQSASWRARYRMASEIVVGSRRASQCLVAADLVSFCASSALLCFFERAFLLHIPQL